MYHKKKVGRHKKIVKVEKRKVGRPKKIIKTEKRKVGRPKKIVQVEKKQREKRKYNKRAKEDLSVIEPELFNDITDVDVVDGADGVVDVGSLDHAVDIDIDIDDEKEHEVEKDLSSASKNVLEQIMFSLPFVPDPLVGTPQQVQKQLDKLAKRLQRQKNNNKLFNKIHLYMHGYLINVVFKKFPYIKGYQHVDIYQESLIALKFKAIPGFKSNMGMSFLNFAKMCIRRHLITILNTSITRKRDRSLNTAISLDGCLANNDSDATSTLIKIMPDNVTQISDKLVEKNESMQITKNTLLGSLSPFEKIVLNEFLLDSSYNEISDNISESLDKKCSTKSIDNALLRIRKKAQHIKKYAKIDEIPIFIKK